jgi:hypothetical protein
MAKHVGGAFCHHLGWRIKYKNLERDVPMTAGGCLLAKQFKNQLVELRSVVAVGGCRGGYMTVEERVGGGWVGIVLADKLSGGKMKKNKNSLWPETAAKQQKTT